MVRFISIRKMKYLYFFSVFLLAITSLQWFRTVTESTCMRVRWGDLRAERLYLAA